MSKATYTTFDSEDVQQLTEWLEHHCSLFYRFIELGAITTTAKFRDRNGRLIRLDVSRQNIPCKTAVGNIKQADFLPSNVRDAIASAYEKAFSPYSDRADIARVYKDWSDYLRTLTGEEIGRILSHDAQLKEKWERRLKGKGWSAITLSKGAEGRVIHELLKRIAGMNVEEDSVRRRLRRKKKNPSFLSSLHDPRSR